MKNICFILLALLICNLSFSQGKIADTIKKNNVEKRGVFRMHPNPVKDVLFILGTNRIKTIELINALGKQAAIYHFNKSIIKIDVSQLKKGIYFIKVTDENNKLGTKRLIVE